MCKYCNTKYPIKYCSNYYEYRYTQYDYNKEKFNEYNQLQKIDVPANYCSNCGRKLEGKYE